MCADSPGASSSVGPFHLFVRKTIIFSMKSIIFSMKSIIFSMKSIIFSMKSIILSIQFMISSMEPHSRCSSMYVAIAPPQ